MPAADASTPLEEFEGTVERIVFTSAENSYTVARFLPEDTRDTLTIVGNFASLNVGETLRIWG